MGLFLKNPLVPAAPLVLILTIILTAPAWAQTQAPEFRLLELEREIRAQAPDPAKPGGRERLFALAEARYDSRIGSADEPLRKLDRPIPNDELDWLTLIYRLKVSKSAEAPKLERRLKDALSGRGYFAVFDADRAWRWHSPLGHQFEFREYVDRLEIYRDEILFFTLQLG